MVRGQKERPCFLCTAYHAGVPPVSPGGHPRPFYPEGLHGGDFVLATMVT